MFRSATIASTPALQGLDRTRLDPDALVEELQLLDHRPDLGDHRLLKMRRELRVLRGERDGVVLHPLGETPNRLGAGLHVALHRLDDPRGLPRDEFAVLSDARLDAVGQQLIASLQRSERCSDVALDLLQLGSDGFDAVERGGVGDLADSVRAHLDGLADPTGGLRELGERVLQAGGADGDGLEPLVARGDQAPDRLIA